MTDKEKAEVYQFYCGNELRELKKICYPLIKNKDVPDMYWDDLYSDAMKVLMESVESYTPVRDCSFSTYLIGNIKKSFYDWSRDSMREKRCNVRRNAEGRPIRDSRGNKIPINNISLNTSYKNDDAEGVEFGDFIPGDEDVELDDIFGIWGMSENIAIYLNRLLPVQRSILVMLEIGYSALDIKRILSIDNDTFRNHIGVIRAYENIRVLF